MLPPASLACPPRGAPALRLIRSLVARQQLDHLLADTVQVRAHAHQHLRGHAITLTEQSQQDVLGTDIVVAQRQRLAPPQLHHLLGPRRERDTPGRSQLALADDLLNLLAYRLQADPQRLQRPGRHSLALMNEAKQQVLGADVVVVQHPGFFLSQDHHPPCPVGKPLKHPRPALRSPTAPQCTSRYIASAPQARYVVSGAAPVTDESDATSGSLHAGLRSPAPGRRRGKDQPWDSLLFTSRSSGRIPPGSGTTTGSCSDGSSIRAPRSRRRSPSRRTTGSWVATRPATGPGSRAASAGERATTAT